MTDPAISDLMRSAVAYCEAPRAEVEVVSHLMGASSKLDASMANAIMLKCVSAGWIALVKQPEPPEWALVVTPKGTRWMEASRCRSRRASARPR